jgi:hypothetical protein
MIRWAVGAVCLLASALPASAGFWSWWNSGWPALPRCGDSAVLYRIATIAGWAERNTWHRGWVIRSISNNVETALDPTHSHVHRRYCDGTAWLSDGRSSEVVYVIEEGMGFASMEWNVEYCLPAYDRWRVYDAWCKAIRP